MLGLNFEPNQVGKWDLQLIVSFTLRRASNNQGTLKNNTQTDQLLQLN